MKTKSFAFSFSAFILTLSICMAPAWAVKSVNSPYVKKDELKLEWKGAFDTDDESQSQDGAQGYDLNTSYGFTDFWASELELEANKSGRSGEDLRTTSLEWKNKFQFTSVKDWIGSGVRIGYRRSLVGTPDRLQAKLLFQKDIGLTAHTANFILTKEIGDDAAKLQGGFALSSRFKWQPWLEPGFEWYGDVGELSNRKKFDDQSHSAGPVFYGQITPELKYDLGYLFGVSDAAPDGEVKARLEYKWAF